MEPNRKQLEAALEAYFRKSVREKLGGHVVKLAPTEKGVPDRLVMLPAGRMFLVELKADGGKLSPAQLYWHDRANHLGIDIHVLEGRGQVFQWCQERMKDFDEMTIAPSTKSQDPNYRAGYRAAAKRFGKVIR